MPRERLVEVGWAKAAVVIENCAPEEMEEALALAETATAKELPALLKGAPRKAKARTVQLRLTPRQSRTASNWSWRTALGVRRKGGACPARRRP
jgi:hypothetical protein